MPPDDRVQYRINAQDEICFVNEAWDRFAIDNDAADLTGDRVCGRPLWDFISEENTRQIYEQLVARVRLGRETTFTLRCDSPSCRRLLEMTISPAEARGVDFTTRILSLEPRAPVPLLARETARSTALLRICAWCNRIPVEPGHWAELEDAIPQLRLFERDGLPNLTHSMCEACHAKLVATVSAM